MAKTPKPPVNDSNEVGVSISISDIMGTKSSADAWAKIAGTSFGIDHFGNLHAGNSFYKLAEAQKELKSLGLNPELLTSKQRAKNLYKEVASVKNQSMVLSKHSISGKEETASFNLLKGTKEFAPHDLGAGPSNTNKGKSVNTAFTTRSGAINLGDVNPNRLDNVGKAVSSRSVEKQIRSDSISGHTYGETLQRSSVYPPGRTEPLEHAYGRQVSKGVTVYDTTGDGSYKHRQELSGLKSKQSEVYDGSTIRGPKGRMMAAPRDARLEQGVSFPKSSVIQTEDTTHKGDVNPHSVKYHSEKARRTLEEGVSSMKNGPLSNILADIKKTFTDISKVASQAFAPIIRAAAPWTSFHTTGTGGPAVGGAVNNLGGSSVGGGGGEVHSVGGGGAGGSGHSAGGGSKPTNAGAGAGAGAGGHAVGGVHTTEEAGEKSKSWLRNRASAARKQVGQQFWHAGTWGVVAPVIGSMAYTASKLVGGDPQTDRSIHALTGVGLNLAQKASTTRWAYGAAGAQPFMRPSDLVDTHKMLISSAETPYTTANAWQFEAASEALQAYSGISMDDPRKAAVDIPRATQLAIQNYAPYKGKGFFEVMPAVMGARALITQQSSVQGHDLNTYSHYAGAITQAGLQWSPGESEAFGAHYIARGSTADQVGAYVRNFFGGANIEKQAKLNLMYGKYMENAKTMGFKAKALPKEMMTRGYWTAKKGGKPSPGYDMLRHEKYRIQQILRSGDKEAQLRYLSEISKRGLWAQKAGIGGAMIGKESDTAIRQMMASDSTQEMIDNMKKKMEVVRAEEENPTVINKALDAQKAGLDTPSGRLSEMITSGQGWLGQVSKDIGADKFFSFMAKRFLTSTVTSNLKESIKLGNKSDILKSFKELEDLAKLGKVSKTGTPTIIPGVYANIAKEQIIAGLSARLPKDDRRTHGWTEVQKLQDFYPDLPKDYFTSQDLYPNIYGSSMYGIPSKATIDTMRGIKPPVTPVKKGPGPVGYEGPYGSHPPAGGAPSSGPEKAEEVYGMNRGAPQIKDAPADWKKEESVQSMTPGGMIESFVTGKGVENMLMGGNLERLATAITKGFKDAIFDPQNLLRGPAAASDTIPHTQVINVTTEGGTTTKTIKPETPSDTNGKVFLTMR